LFFIFILGRWKQGFKKHIKTVIITNNFLLWKINLFWSWWCSGLDRIFNFFLQFFQVEVFWFPWINFNIVTCLDIRYYEWSDLRELFSTFYDIIFFLTRGRRRIWTSCVKLLVCHEFVNFFLELILLVFFKLEILAFLVIEFLCVCDVYCLQFLVISSVGTPINSIVHFIHVYLLVPIHESSYSLVEGLWRGTDPAMRSIVAVDV